MLLTVIISLLLLIVLLAQPASAFAHCPLCVAGAAGGLTLARIFGIDDSITGVWIGALIGATSFWAEKFVYKRIKIFPLSILRQILYFTFFALTIASFYQLNLVVKMGDIFGVHKLTFGMIAGGVLFYLVDLVNDYVIKKNAKVLFPYQRIVVSLGSMVALSIGIYILINYYI
ncbi:hypothetical protein HYT59_01760 [Candidatus Woesebacteria bacterium]|nr:hypothetical protein [Candidatus Woesebacteria bacterium]